MVEQVFVNCCTIKSQSLIDVIKSFKLGDSSVPAISSTPLIQAADKFVRGFSEQLIVQYCALTETIANK